MPRAASTWVGVDRTGMGERDGHLERREHLAAVAAGAIDQVGDGLVARRRALRGEAAPHQLLDGFVVERLPGGTGSTGCAAAG